MTDPKPTALTPDQLRALADRHRRQVEAWNGSLDFATAGDNDEFTRESIDMIRLHGRTAAALDQAASDREALNRVRATIHAAPHATECDISGVWASGRCTCWKAAALRDEQDGETQQ